MKAMFVFASLAALVCVGCGKAADTPAKSGSSGSDSASSSSSTSGSSSDAGGSRSVREEPITPENMKIEFVGTHTPPKEPEPRTGTFTKFNGTATVDKAAKTLNAVAVEIDTTSIQTFNEKLTNHLNSPDFFDTREYPTAKFVSKKIEPAAEEGMHEIVGDLTLHGQTREVSFPAKIAVEDADLKVNASFKIDRTKWGMDKMLEGAEKDVTINITGGKQ